MTDPRQLKRVADWHGEDILFCIARLPETARLFVGSSDFKVYELDVAAESPARVPFEGDGHRSYVTGAALAGETLVTGSYDGRLLWWHIGDHTLAQDVTAHDKWIRRVIATPDASRIISVADDMQAKAWDAASGELIKAFTDHAVMTPHDFPSMLYAVAASPDGRWLATGDKTGHVAVWDLVSYEKVGQVEAPVLYTWDPKQRRHSIGGIRSLAFSPDGTKLAVGGIGTIGNVDHLDGKSRVEVFEWQTGTRLFELEDEKRKGLVEQIAWSPDGAMILCAGGDHAGFLKFYDMTSGELIHQDGNDGHIHGFVTDEAWSTIYTACHNRVEKWSINTAE
jgi:WD40 repeat protein